MTTFGERLKELLKEKEWTEQDFAAEIKVDPTTMSRWMKGKHAPREETCQLIAQLLQVPYPYLMGWDDSRDWPVYTEEETAEQEENHLMELYRMLSPAMKKMISSSITQAYIVDKERGALKL